MIKLYDADITKVMPPALANDLNTKCLAYAIQKEHQRLMDLANATRLMSMIDDVPEHILDLLAVELRSPYYLETLDVEIKRYIVKRTLIWHQKAGTPNAVTELITIAFGEGKVIEWFDFTDPPYTPGTFDIETNAPLKKDAIDYFTKIIYRVKNTRSHLRRLIVNRKIESNIYVGGLIDNETNVTIDNSFQKEYNCKKSIYIGGALAKQRKVEISNTLQKEDSLTHNLYVGAVLISCPKIRIN